MSEEDYKLWQREIEAISQRIVDLHEAIETTVEVTKGRQRVTRGLLGSLQAMTDTKKQLFTLYQHGGKVLA